MLLPGSKFHYDFTKDPFCSTVLDSSEINSSSVDKRAVLMGNPTWVPEGLYFNGTDSYCNMIDNSDANITAISNDRPLIMGAILKVASGSSSGYILCKSLSTYNDAQYSMYFDASGGGVLNTYIGGVTKKSSTIITTEKFHFILISQTAETFNFFLNGKLDYSTARTLGTLSTKPNLKIGCRSNSEDGTLNSIFFKGIIAEVFVCQGSQPQDIVNWFTETSRPQKYDIPM